MTAEALRDVYGAMETNDGKGRAASGFAPCFQRQRRESSSSFVLVLVLGVRDGRYWMRGGTRRLSPPGEEDEDDSDCRTLQSLGLE